MRVGVTGISSDLGKGLLSLLEADRQVERIVAIDVAAPEHGSGKTEFVHADLTRPDAEADLIRAMRDARLDALYHLAFVNSRVHGAAFAHELEVIGTMHVLAAAQATGLARLILPSLTLVYGARAGAPAVHSEQHELLGRGVRFITDRVEVEQQAAAFAQRNPGTHLIILRFGPIVGPTSDNPFTRLIRSRFVPTLLGFDPLWQVLHESDAAHALHLALTAEAAGAFNIVGHEPAPLSTLLRLAGASTAPLPGPLLRSTIRTLEAVGVATVPVAMLDFLKYSWLADGRRAANALGFKPTIGLREAMASIRAPQGA
jgi:UDP-glucose 4-epimerase